MWMGGAVPYGYDVEDKKLVANEQEAATVRYIFEQYLRLRSLPLLIDDLDDVGIRTRKRELTSGRTIGGCKFTRGPLAILLKNPVYAGKVKHKGIVYDGEHEGLICEEHFNEVQQILASNNRRKVVGSNSKTPSLLSGMIVDPQGNPMSPQRGQKDSKVYCYYVSRTKGDEEDSKPYRAPAGSVDGIVLQSIAEWLGKPSCCEESDQGKWLEDKERKGKLVTILETGSTVEKREVLLDLKCSVQLCEEHLRISCQYAGSNKPTTIERPIKLTRRGHEIKLIDTSGTSPETADPVLLRLIAQGFAAREHLINGEKHPLVEGLSKRHLSRLARLSLLAPDIIQAIAEGRQPPNLTGRELLRRGDVPLAWNKQRDLLGFA